MDVPQSSLTDAASLISRVILDCTNCPLHFEFETLHSGRKFKVPKKENSFFFTDCVCCIIVLRLLYIKEHVFNFVSIVVLSMFLSLYCKSVFSFGIIKCLNQSKNMTAFYKRTGHGKYYKTITNTTLFCN